MALVGYVGYGWPLALLAIVVVGLPVHVWLRRSGRLDRRTVLVGATFIGALALPGIGSAAGGDRLWGQPLLYAWGALAGLVAGMVFARVMRVGDRGSAGRIDSPARRHTSTTPTGNELE